jgi:hypothetical protein
MGHIEFHRCGVGHRGLVCVGVADMGVPEFPIVLVVVASSEGAEVKQSIIKGNRFVYIVGDVVGSFVQECELSLYFHV